ncbi:hypothetical protein ACI782_02935 [Geodermatophilus sp. SYSU D00703]
MTPRPAGTVRPTHVGGPTVLLEVAGRRLLAASPPELRERSRRMPRGDATDLPA